MRRLLVNAAYWATGLENQITANADVAIVGEYQPLPFGFGAFKSGVKPEQPPTSLIVFGLSLCLSVRTCQPTEPIGSSRTRKCHEPPEGLSGPRVARGLICIRLRCAGRVARPGLGSGHDRLDDLGQVFARLGQAVEVVLPLTARRG